MPSIYIINPAVSTPSYYTAEFFAEDREGWVLVADLTIATLAAFVPEGWDIRLTDEGVTPADLDADVDFVAITGKTSQRNRMIELADEFRRRGRTVLIGGPFASLVPDDMRGRADILVTGEIEEIAPRLFADLASGNWSDFYDGGRADIRLSPVPRWDLYPTHRASTGTLQTTRGCPFACEFCDVIQYQGRKQRHKDVEQVLAELDALYVCGFRAVYLVDDNFTVHRAFARTMLDALAEWNSRHASDPVTFITQASLDIARDDDMLNRCRDAGMRVIFIGIETVNRDSLRETGKKQNLLMPIVEAVNKVVSFGIAVQAGIIVGFDHDTPRTFDDLVEFFEDCPIPELDINTLLAPNATDLFRRMTREGRILGNVWECSAASPFATNFTPAGMTMAELLDGVAELCRLAYRPDRFRDRMLRMIDTLGDVPAAHVTRAAPASNERLQTITRGIGRISALGPAEAEMVQDVLRAARAKPGTLLMALHFLAKYGQIRYALDMALKRRQDAEAGNFAHSQAPQKPVSSGLQLPQVA